jgi:hypothetical protein
VLLAALIPLGAAQQAPEESQPIERENLIEALKTGKLPEQKAIEVIARQKLSFVMTAEYADDFRKLGAGETLIYTLWKNDAYVVKKGPALTKDEIVTLLESGVPPPRVERIVEVRKAKLVLDAPASKEIRDAGGSDTLLGVILMNLVVVVEVPGAAPVKSPPTADEMLPKGRQGQAPAGLRVSPQQALYAPAIPMTGQPKQTVPASRQSATLVVYNIEYSFGSSTFFVDGRPIVKLHSRRYVKLKVEPGMRHLQIGSGKGLTVDLEIYEGQTIHVPVRGGQTPNKQIIVVRDEAAALALVQQGGKMQLCEDKDILAPDVVIR